MGAPIINDENLSVNQERDLSSGISHGFDTGHAIAYGVDEAIMIRNLQFFITANANRRHNFRQGRYWTYDRIEDFPNHFPYWSVQNVRRIITSLIKQGVIIKGEFNEKWSNRTQWYAFKDQDKFIKNIKVPQTPSPLPPADLPIRATEDFQKKNADLLIPTTDRCWNQQLTDVDSNICNIGTSAIPSAIPSSSSLKVPAEADASGACAVSSCKKPKKEKPDFSSKVRETTDHMLLLLKKHNPVYRPPKDMTKFLGHVQEIIEEDEQNVDVVLKTFEWAVSDNEKRGDFNGWQGIVATNNKGSKSTTPAEIFRKHFSKIHSQMSSRPKRKFAASSDDNAAMEIMEEMNKRAI